MQQLDANLPRWFGPATIAGIDSNGNYTLKFPNGNYSKRRYARRMLKKANNNLSTYKMRMKKVNDVRKKDGGIEYKVSYIGYHTDADQWLKEEQIMETNPILFNNFKTAIQEYDNNIGQLDENELLSTVLEELDTNVFTQLKDAREGISFNMLEDYSGLIWIGTYSGEIGRASCRERV